MCELRATGGCRRNASPLLPCGCPGAPCRLRRALHVWTTPPGDGARLPRDEAGEVDALERALASDAVTPETRACLLRAARLCVRAYGLPRASASATLGMLLAPLRTCEQLACALTNACTLKTTLSAFLAVFKHAPWLRLRLPHARTVFNEAHDTARLVVAAQQASGRPTDAKSSSVVTWARVLDVQRLALRRRARARDAGTDDDALILAMYTMIPPRRQRDYHRVFIKGGDAVQQLPVTLPSPAAPAWVDLDQRPGWLHVHGFKTEKHFGPFTCQLPVELDALLRDSAAARPRDYVFVTPRRNAFASANAFTKHTNARLAHLFSLPVTVNSLRHAYATHMSSRTDVSLQERHEAARRMGHSLEQHMGYAHTAGGAGEDARVVGEGTVGAMASMIDTSDGRPTQVDKLRAFSHSLVAGLAIASALTPEQTALLHRAVDMF